MSNTVMIIDGNSICRAAHNGTKLTVGKIQTQAIFGTIRTVRGLIEKYPGAKILILWDGKAQWRKAIYPDYKGNRKPKDAKAAAHDDAYKAQSAFVRKSLQLLGVRQMFALTHEADDMAGVFSQRLSKAGNPILLVTRDHDWLQLINPNVRWYSPIDDYLVDTNSFTKFTGYFGIDAFLEGKAIQGDTSDNIAGIDRVGKGTAPKILAEFGSMEKFYSQCDSGVFKPRLKIHTNLNAPEGREIFKRNMKLMDLRNVPTPDSKDIVIIQPEYNEEKFRLLCEKLAFVSILRNFDTSVYPFKKLSAKAA